MNTWYENLVEQVVAGDTSGPLIHRRIDESWTHEVDPNPLRRQLRGNARPVLTMMLWIAQPRL
jgi:hypothetical protein